MLRNWDIEGANQEMAKVLEPALPTPQEWQRKSKTTHLPQAGELIAFEICCGHGGLTKALREVGFDALGVDFKGNKHKTCVPVLTADLTTERGREYVRSLFRKYKIAYVHMAPPCGTCSRAREKPIPQHLIDQGAPNPQPLRSDEHPEGLPGLGWVDQVKVNKANAIADFCTEISHLCISLQVGFSIENPTNSILWLLPRMKDLANTHKVFSVPFQNCMWGSKRNKWTSVLTNVPQFCTLKRECDGSHDHLSWTVRWNKGWSFPMA